MHDRPPNISHGKTRHGHWFLVTTIELPLAIHEVFAFFANAENLERISPPELAFEILTPTPIDVGEGTIIDYRLRLFHLPFAPAGALVLPLVRQQLDRIFRFRASAVTRLLRSST